MPPNYTPPRLAFISVMLPAAVATESAGEGEEAPYGWQLKQRIPVDVITEVFTYLVVARVRTVEIVR